MKNFRYKARDKFGKSVVGELSGENKNAVASHLSATGYIPISIEEATPGQKTLFTFFKGVRLEELNSFTRQLATMQKAGVPLLLSFNAIEKQITNKYFKDIIKEIGSHIEGGMSLSEAFAKFPAVFNELYISMVRVGEAGGLLDEVLERLADFGDKELDTQNRIKVATRYPILTMIALAGAFILLVTFVIPRFASLFSQFKTDLPLPTKILLGVSYAIQHYWYFCLIGLGILVFLFLKYISTPRGRYRWDSFKLKFPILDKLFLAIVMSRFSRTTSVLTRSGVPILQVLELVSRTVGNAVVAAELETIATSVREGKGLSIPMSQSGIFSPMVLQMVAIGEETGKIDELLMKVADYYDQQSDFMIKNLTTLIEPIFIVALGAMVLIMALGIFLPMWNLASLFRH